MGNIGSTWGIIIILIIALFMAVAILPWFFIYKKAGYHPAMGCLMFIPIANVIMLFVLAFSQWPIERDLENARSGRPD
jgi:uncharacterized SAM-binding protein YcdF (DUF218 family)